MCSRTIDLWESQGEFPTNHPIRLTMCINRWFQDEKIGKQARKQQASRTNARVFQENLVPMSTTSLTPQRLVSMTQVGLVNRPERISQELLKVSCDGLQK